MKWKYFQLKIASAYACSWHTHTHSWHTHQCSWTLTACSSTHTLTYSILKETSQMLLLSPKCQKQTKCVGNLCTLQDMKILMSEIDSKFKLTRQNKASLHEQIHLSNCNVLWGKLSHNIWRIKPQMAILPIFLHID